MLAVFIRPGKGQLTKRRPTVLTKESGNFIRNTLGTCEDEDLVLLVAHDGLEMLGHAVTLLELCADLDDLLNTVVSREVHGTNVDLDPVLLVVSSQLADFLRPCSRPHASLTIGTNLSNDLANLRLKTHVKHAVGLVQNEVSNAAEVRFSCFEHINKTSRSGNAHFNTAGKVTDLRTLGNTSVDTGVSNARRFSELANLLLNLDSKFTCGSEDENDRTIARSEERLGVDVDDGGKTVGEGLSGTSFSNTNNIATRESHGPTLRLNSSRLCEALSLDLVHNVGWETSLIEGCDWLGNVCALDSHLVLLAVFGNLSLGARGDCGILLVERLFELGHSIKICSDVSAIFA